MNHIASVGATHDNGRLRYFPLLAPVLILFLGHKPIDGDVFGMLANQQTRGAPVAMTQRAGLVSLYGRRWQSSRASLEARRAGGGERRN